MVIRTVFAIPAASLWLPIRTHGNPLCWVIVRFGVVRIARYKSEMLDHTLIVQTIRLRYVIS